VEHFCEIIGGAKPTKTVASISSDMLEKKEWSKRRPGTFTALSRNYTLVLWLEPSGLSYNALVPKYLEH
jgi:hypothetical protein